MLRAWGGACLVRATLCQAACNEVGQGLADGTGDRFGEGGGGRREEGAGRDGGGAEFLGGGGGVVGADLGGEAVRFGCDAGLEGAGSLPRVIVEATRWRSEVGADGLGEGGGLGREGGGESLGDGKVGQGGGGLAGG